MFSMCREVDGQWEEEEKLEAHSDWVRDVAWAPNVGLSVSTMASCSQVSEDLLLQLNKLNNNSNFTIELNL